MLFKHLLQDIQKTYKNEVNIENLEVNQISKDSKSTQNGDAFFCLKHDFEKAYERCNEALQNGASVVVSDYTLPFPRAVQVNDVREAFSFACANFYDRACDDLVIVGVTGTNGKTTTSHLIAEILKRNGKKTGVIGTNGVFYNGKILDCQLTTPDADFLHKTFKEMRDDGVEYVIMEVSAHAIDQKRCNGIKFELGVLTNITQDHLDYFKTLENYEKTKLSFFDSSHMKKGIICVDDARARKILDKTDIPLLTYGLFNPSDVFAIDVSSSMRGSHFVANICDSILEMNTNLVGEYNVYNSLAALSVCQCLGLSDIQLADGMSYINPVEGRFNVINLSGKNVVIDFAHSPDGLLNVLKTARKLTDKKLYVIFGCGGNRDKGKRHQMGEIAERYADVVCLTDDNPRLERADNIIADIEQGMKKPHMVLHDRYIAIKSVLDIAEAGDIVVVAGKGAEKTQEIGMEKHIYNDFDSVYKYFKEKSPEKSWGKERYDC